MKEYVFKGESPVMGSASVVYIKISSGNKKPVTQVRVLVKK
jgi:hypothetical protein